jgi:hypothetical protein|tara:strand:- start:552 stop:749 length:198 start_codon:yes stop_codon:yes gene_type:complete
MTFKIVDYQYKKILEGEYLYNRIHCIDYYNFLVDKINDTTDHKEKIKLHNKMLYMYTKATQKKGI